MHEQTYHKRKLAVSKTKKDLSDAVSDRHATLRLSRAGATPPARAAAARWGGCSLRSPRRTRAARASPPRAMQTLVRRMGLSATEEMGLMRLVGEVEPDGGRARHV